MKKWLSVKNAVLTAAALAIVAIGVAYAVEIQRGVGGSVIVGTVDTVEDTILLWQSVDPEEVPLTQLDFGRADISAFGLMKSPGSLPFWVENGDDVAFDLRLEVTDVRVNGVPAGDALRLVFSHAPPPTPTPRPAAVPGRAPTPTLVPPSFDIDEVHSGTDPRVDEPTSTPTPSRPPVPVPSWEHLGTFLPGQVMAFEAGLRFLRTPQQLGISTDDQITFTGLFRAEGPVPTPTPRPPARHKLVVALPTFGQESNLPWTLSSFSLVDLRPMFEYLIGVHPESGELVPQLAESWSASPDRTQWTFNLRQRVAFHHG